MRNRVVVTGMGCISPAGNDPSSAWQNVIQGKSGVSEITRFDTSEFKTKFAAQVQDFDPKALFGPKEARRMDRFAQFAVTASQQAVQNARLAITDENRERIGVIIGTGIGGLGTLVENMEIFMQRGPMRVSPFLVPMMLPDTGAAMVAIHLGLRGPNAAFVTACATGTNAVGEAAEMIRRGQADVILAGGSEAAIVPLAMAGLNVMTALSTRNEDPQRASRPFDRTRDGFVIGEGSAILVLESLEHAQQRGAAILAEVSGYGSTNDAYDITAPAENGAGAAASMRIALESAGLSTGDIDYINAHGTSTVLNDRSETAAIKTIFGEQAYKVPISSTKSMTGHLLGASGALEALFCVQAIQNCAIPPTINYEFPDPQCDLDYVPNHSRQLDILHAMSNSFGFGGHNATIILSKYAEVTE